MKVQTKQKTAARNPVRDRAEVKVSLPAKRPAAGKKGKTKTRAKVVNVLSPHFLTEEEVVDAFEILGISQKITDPNRLKMFIKMAVRNQLDPLKREIHAVERNVKVKTVVPGKGTVESWETVLTPVVGYEVFIDRAELTGRLQYWYPLEEGVIDLANQAKSTYKVVIVIKRKDWPKEFRLTTKHSEVAADNAMWKKEGSFMTMKVGISRAFRLCFREVLRNMPYTAEEELTRQEYGDEQLVGLKEPQKKLVASPPPEPDQPASAPPAAEPPVGQPLEDEAKKRAKEEAAKEFAAAHAETKRIYVVCEKSGLFEEEGRGGLKDMRDQAQKALDARQLQSLRDLAVAWQIEYAERKERKDKGGKA